MISLSFAAQKASLVTIPRPQEDHLYTQRTLPHRIVCPPALKQLPMSSLSLKQSQLESKQRQSSRLSPQVPSKLLPNPAHYLELHRFKHLHLWGQTWQNLALLHREQLQVMLCMLMLTVRAIGTPKLHLVSHNVLDCFCFQADVYNSRS